MRFFIADAKHRILEAAGRLTLGNLIRWGRPFVLFAAVIVAWIACYAAGSIPRVFLPSPFDVLGTLASSLRDGSLATDLKISAFRVFAGFAISFAVAVPLGIAIGTAARFREYVQPFNEFLRYIPVPAMLPLLILWLGIGNRTQIAVIVFGTLPQLLVLVADAVTGMPKTYKELCASIHLRRWQTLSHAVVPYASPQIYDAARITLGWAWSYLLVAEIIGANQGLGQRIILGQRFLHTEQVMAGILVVAMLGMTIDAILRSMYPALFPWAERSRDIAGRE